MPPLRGITVDFAVPERFSCGGPVPFRIAALERPRGFERGSSRLARAVDAFLGRHARDIGQARRGWFLLAKRADIATVAHGRGPSYGYMVFGLRGERWVWDGSGGCRPRAWRHGLEAVPWRVGTAPSSDGRTVRILVREQSCSSGQTAEDRVLRPWVHYGPEQVTVTFHVRPVDGVATCQGSPPTPVDLVLEGPLGERALADGGVVP